MFYVARKLMRRFVAIGLIASLYFAGINNAHIHLSETHMAGDPHHHGAEVHVAHPALHHDSITGDEEHATDASFVELDQVGNLAHDLNLPVLLFVVLVYLLAALVLHAARGWPLRERVFRIDTPLSARLGARAPP